MTAREAGGSVGGMRYRVFPGDDSRLRFVDSFATVAEAAEAVRTALGWPEVHVDLRDNGQTWVCLNEPVDVASGEGVRVGAVDPKRDAQLAREMAEAIDRDRLCWACWKRRCRKHVPMREIGARFVLEREKPPAR